jgi:hypothetical protein
MFSIGIFLTLVSLSLAVEVPGFFNNTQCVYVPSSRTFTCQYGEHKVECSAVSNFTLFGTTTYHLFGIGRLGETFVNSPVDSVYFSLYPRGFDNVTYTTSTVGTHETVLYYGENFVHYGIRVLDVGCFKQIFELFGTITDYHVVTVGTTPVSLIGEVLISDSTVQKRWLWGYGFGYGYPYYGWGGWGGMYGMGYYPGLWWGK